MPFTNVVKLMIFLDLVGPAFSDGDTSVYYAGFSHSGQEASNTCAAYNARLPSVKLHENNIEVQDQFPGYQSECYWLGAKYERIADYTDGSYPRTCCEVFMVESDRLTTDCVSCQSNYPFLCKTDLYKTYPVDSGAVTWLEAFQQCSNKHFSLPTNLTNDDRANFQSPKWRNVVRRLNIAPRDYHSDDLFLCHCFGTKHQGCVPFLKAICIQDPTNAKSTTDTTTSRKIHMADTTSIMFSSPTVNTDGIFYPLENITNKQATLLSTHVWGTSYSSMIDSPSKSTETNLETLTKGSSQNDSMPGIWPVLGGTLGAFVCIIIVAIVIVILLRRRRITNSHDKILSYTTNQNPTVIIQTQRNLSYDTIVGESFALEAPTSTHQQDSTAQVEPETHSQLLQIKNKSENLLTDPINIAETTDEKENTILYSKVQKGQKGSGKPIKLKESDGIRKDDYDITFMELRKDEFVENMYSKANFHHAEFREGQTTNAYDNLNFRHEVVVIDTGNEYEKTKVNRPESSNYDTTYMINHIVDSTYDHLK